MSTALKMYGEDSQGAHPPALAQLSPQYLKAVPTCPTARCDTYSAAYVGAQGAYTLVCGGHHHKAVGRPANYPQYTSAGGLIDR